MNLSHILLSYIAILVQMYMREEGGDGGGVCWGEGTCMIRRWDNVR